nr:hypothetical protein [Tanacetum cinerariifolium]
MEHTYHCVEEQAEIDTLRLDDLYNNLKIYKLKIKGTSSSNTNIQNVAFVSSNSTNNTNGAVNNAHGATTATTQATDVNSTTIDNLSDAVICAFFMVVLTIKARRFLKNTGRKFSMNGNETFRFDKSKVECYNCHKGGHFVTECRVPRSQDTKHNESTRRIVPVETIASIALVSCDGLGGYDWSDQVKEGPTNFTLMAYSFTSSNSESVYEEDIKALKSKIHLREVSITELRRKLELAQKQKDKIQLTVENFKNSSKNLSKLIDYQIVDKCKIGLGYNVVSPPYTGNFMPSKPDLSSQEEFVNKSIVTEPTVKHHVFKTSEAKASTDKPKVVRKNFASLLIKDWISDSEDEVESKPKIEMKTFKLSFAKIEFVKSKEQVKSPIKTTDKQRNPKMDLQGKGVINSECSRHMIGNMSYLTDYEEIDGGYVAFGGNPKGRKITGKVYTSCIEQFWATVKAKTVNRDVQLQALVDGKKIIITKSTIRRDLKLEDVEGVDCLPNAGIFKQLTLMGEGKDFSGRETPLFPTMMVQAQKDIDEAINEEMNDNLERAATTATSLDAEQDGGDIYKTQSKAPPNEPGSQGTNSSGGPRCQEIIGDTVAQTRSERVSKISNDPLLTKVNTPRSGKDSLKLNELMELCTKLQQRFLDLETIKTTQALEIDNLKRFGEEDASKQGRIADIDANEVIYLVNVHNDEDMFGVNDLDGDEVIVESVDVVEKAKEVVVDITLAKALIEIKSAKPKADKVKIDADYELAQRLQAEEQKELTDAEKEKLFMQLLEKRRKFFAAKRVKEKRNRPPTRAQPRSIIAGEELEQDNAKKHKMKDDKESIELKQFLEIFPNERDDVTVDAAPLSSMSPIIVDYKIHKEGKKSYF